MTRTLTFLALGISAIACRAEWKPLFNGKDLEGWSGDPRLWRVENGVLTGETNDTDKKTEANTFLIWQGGEPADFIMEFQARITCDNNSGLQYRSKVVDAAKWSVGGYQMDLHPKAEYLAMLYEERGRGIACLRGQKVDLADNPTETGKLPVPAVDLAAWNTFRIEAKGDRVSHFVNGQPAAEITDKHPEKRSAKGVIALQLHAGPAMKAEFKDLRIDMSPDFMKTQGAAAPAVKPVCWIWSGPNAGNDEKVFFRRDFTLPADVADATITVTCDNRHHLFVNSTDLGAGGEWQQPSTYDIKPHLKPGIVNTIAIEGLNAGGAAGLAVRLDATLTDESRFQLFSDESWLCSNEATEGWQTAGKPPTGWKPAVVIARMGEQPWGNILVPPPSYANTIEDMTANYQVAPGFKLERIFQIPTSKGSWVGVTVDDKGNLWCADQYGKIHLLTVPAKPGQAVVTKPVDIPLQGAHGLLWLDGVLWVCANEGTDQSGVWRVTDTNADGLPDKPELIKAVKGSGEHGPHSLVAAPDGKSIYFIAGNHTDLAEMDGSLVPRVWQEDQLLPRRPDARGHAADRMAPGGWIARFTPDGKNWQLYSIGYRNQFDAAFNTQGDLFTYDSDMEWDLGMPWYRPTRFCHVVPGSEFGWRNGTGKWPDYYEDSMPSQLDIGPGSPTGMVSGRGAKFPAKYQQAIFGLDWTFATIYALHLAPDGAGYKAEREEFISGGGLPLTDAVIGADGAMYFLTGGRKTDSALWRVTYVGKESTAPVSYETKELAPMEPAKAPAALGGRERIARFQARTTLENAGPEILRGMIKSDSANPWQVLGSAIGLARTGTAADAPVILAALDRLEWAKLDVHQQLNWLRAVGLVFARHGYPDAAARDKVLAKIDALFPASDAMLNRELCRMLSYLQAPGIVARTLTLMDSAGPSPAPDWLALAKRNANYGKTVENMIANLPPDQVIHYVYCLRVVKGPWHGDERKRFFNWITKLTGNSGGASYAGFITDLRNETLANCTPEEVELVKTFDTAPPPNPFANLPAIKGPGRQWTVDEVVKLAEEGLEGRDRENGKKIFQGALCAACHRHGNEGGAAGPDLTTLGGRFGVREIVEAIQDPNNVVSDQYAFSLITRHDGTVISGKITGDVGGKSVIATNPFDFTQTITIDKSDIREVKKSPASPMPPGLINRLNPDELKDLLAFLLKGA